MAHELNLDEIEVRRKAKGLTVAQLAKAAGLPESTLYHALRGRAPSDDTLHKLTKVLLDHSTENPLLRDVSADEMLQQNIAGLAKMEREAARRQTIVKADETLGQARLREALAATQTPAREEAFLVRKGEELELAVTIAKGTGATREEVIAQLLAADPSRMGRLRRPGAPPAGPEGGGRRPSISPAPRAAAA